MSFPFSSPLPQQLTFSESWLFAWALFYKPVWSVQQPNEKSSVINPILQIRKLRCKDTKEFPQITHQSTKILTQTLIPDRPILTIIPQNLSICLFSSLMFYSYVFYILQMDAGTTVYPKRYIKVQKWYIKVFKIMRILLVRWWWELPQSKKKEKFRLVFCFCFWRLQGASAG